MATVGYVALLAVLIAHFYPLLAAFVVVAQADYHNDEFFKLVWCKRVASCLRAGR